MVVAATRPNLSRVVFETIRADILTCRLHPGARLKIAELAERFEVSLGAVREALSALAAEGLVLSEAQRGFRVSPVSTSDLSDLTVARVEIESAALRLAISHGDVAWEAEIVAAYHRLSKAPERVAGDPDRLNDTWVEAHNGFHAALAAGCGNHWLLRFRRTLYEQTERYRRLSVPAANEERDVGGEHKAIMDAVLARDTARAVTLLSHHIATTTRLLGSIASNTDESA